MMTIDNFYATVMYSLLMKGARDSKTNIHLKTSFCVYNEPVPSCYELPVEILFV